jgi:LAO/AO transport system kinase
VQAMKAGIMEIADVFVANKADREGIDRLVQSIEAALSLQPAAEGEWTSPVLKTEAATGRGVAELWDSLCTFRRRSDVLREQRRRARAHARIRALTGELLFARLERTLPAGAFERAAADVAARRRDPYRAARELADALSPSGAA